MDIVDDNEEMLELPNLDDPEKGESGAIQVESKSAYTAQNYILQEETCIKADDNNFKV